MNRVASYKLTDTPCGSVGATSDARGGRSRQAGSPTQSGSAQSNSSSPSSSSVLVQISGEHADALAQARSAQSVSPLAALSTPSSQLRPSRQGGDDAQSESRQSTWLS